MKTVKVYLLDVTYKRKDGSTFVKTQMLEKIRRGLLQMFSRYPHRNCAVEKIEFRGWYFPETIDIFF